MARERLDVREKLTVITEAFLITLANRRGGDLDDCNIGELDFSSSRFDLENIEKLDVVNWRQVTSINFNHNSLERLDELLQKFSLLEYLTATNNLITQASLVFPNLLLLDLGSNYLREIPDMRGLPKLQRLILNSNEISSRLEELQKTPHLEYIDLSLNKLDMPKLQVEAFVMYLKKLSKLKSIFVSDNKFTRSFPNYESFFIKHLTHLFTINGRTIESRDRIAAANVMLIGIDDSKEGPGVVEEVAMPTLQQLVTLINKAKTNPLTSIDNIRELSRSVDMIVRRVNDRYIIFKANSSEEHANLVRC